MEINLGRSNSSSNADSWFADDQQLAENLDRLRSLYVNDRGQLTWADAVDIFLADHSGEDRFGARWASGLWGRWLDRDRALVGRTETTLMMSLTASPWLSDECLLPPSRHLDAVLRGRDVVLSTLKDDLDDNYRVGWALGAQKTGYAHCHIGIWCFNRTEPVAVEPAINAFLDVVPNASPDAHGVGAVTSRHRNDLLADRTVTEDRGPATKLGVYLVDNIPGSGSQPRAGMGVDNELGAGDRHRVRLAALLDATGTEAYSRPKR